MRQPRSSRIPEPDQFGQRWFSTPNDLEELFDLAMIRERPHFRRIEAHPACVHIGGGNKAIAGWSHLDYPEWDAETDDLPYGDSSISDIIVCHALDHWSAPAVVRFLKEAQRVLMTGGGTLTIVVPHHMSTLAWECLEHKTYYGIKTWRNILENPAYDPHLNENFEWKLRIGFNMIMGVEERNLVLVTQLIRE